MGSRKVYLALLLFSLSLLITGLILSPPAEILRGLKVIVTSENTLITDYFAIAGAGAALVNSALVTIISIALLYFSKEPACGTTIMTAGLMAGFSLFGKNILNIWPIIFGTWIYAAYERQSFMKYMPIALLSTTLSPIVNFIALRDGGTFNHCVVAIFTGLVIGFVMPPLANYTYRIYNGMNLYNTGFAAGTLAMILVPLARAFGNAPEGAYFWSTEYEKPMLIYLAVILAVLFVLSFVLDKHVLKKYISLILSRQHAPNDYLVKFGGPAVMLNTSLCGAIAVVYILLTGGDINGPTLGAIFTVMCFSSSGKNPRNIAPIMLGVLIGSLSNVWRITAPEVQLAGLFCTTLAPITDCFGFVAGVFAGFLHSSVVLYAGSPLAGLNLYNNGFAGGIVAAVLYPVLSSVLKHRRARLENKDYVEAINITNEE